MPASSLVSATDLLYLLCSLLLLGSAALVWARDPRSALHRRYALTALSLLGWTSTLALFYRSSDASLVQGLGRANFAFAALSVCFGYLLVRSLAGNGGKASRPGREHEPLAFLLVSEALLLAALSAFTPLIDRAELVHLGAGGRHLTQYGALFPLYVVHVLGYLGASAITAFQARQTETTGPVRDRLTLVGTGVLATGLVGVVSDILLPYGWGDFRFTDAGPLSTALFLLAVGYAVTQRGLFNVRLLVRKTLVDGLVLSLVLAVYSTVVVLVTDKLAGEGRGTFTRVTVLILAFSTDPLRRFLETQADRLLFPDRRAKRR